MGSIGSTGREDEEDYVAREGQIDQKSVWVDNNDQYSLAPRTKRKLPSGLYTCTVTMQGARVFNKKSFTTDELIVLDNSPSQRVLKEIEQFWESRNKFVENGFLHKRGFLLGGPPGGGKTATINLVVQSIIEDHDGIAIYVKDPSVAADCLQDLRKAEPDRPLVAIMEDLDDLVDRYNDTMFLALLDGEHQIDNIVFIATTNYAHKLKERIVKRPSRFDTCLHIGMPCEDVRRIFINKKMDLDEESLDYWVRMTDGLSVAHIKEVIILNLCFDIPVDEAVKRFDELDLKKLEDEFEQDQKNPIGFGR